MSSKNNANVKTGFYSILIAIFYYIFQNTQKEDPPHLPPKNHYKNTNKFIQITSQNYKEILQGDWVIYINLLNEEIDSKSIKRILKYKNFGILKIDSFDSAKLAQVFEPTVTRSFYLVKDSYILKMCGFKRKIDFESRLDPFASFDYWLFVKWNLLMDTVQKILVDNKFYCLYTFTSLGLNCFFFFLRLKNLTRRSRR